MSIGDYSVSLSPLAFLWTAALVVVFIRTTLGVVKWAGPADAMYAAHQINEPLDIKRGFASTLAAFTSASGGASVGQYGPLVHFGATMGVWVKRFLTSRLSHDVYLGCGVAAAISAGFNAPIAGVVFAHEAVLRHFSLRAIAPIAVASVTASALGTSWFPRVSGFDVSFSVPELGGVSARFGPPSSDFGSRGDGFHAFVEIWCEFAAETQDFTHCGTVYCGNNLWFGGYLGAPDFGIRN